ncbi:MAG: hypothetical protein M3Y72_05210 [Acidobacteriota bacterium]|nr:hypothetical protein [Acidobacteriota bacterium]
MSQTRLLILIGCGAAFASFLGAGDDLGPDQQALLHDSGGWEYISIDDSQNGFPTQHTCFDGQPHPETCSGILTLTPQNTFTQRVFIHHQRVERSGTYQLNGDQLAFFDEFGTQDGPYTIGIDAPNKLMMMDMPQVKVRLQLYKEYRKQLDAARKKKK